MPEFVIKQVVRCESFEEAEKVALERFGYDEDYGFEYRFGDRKVENQTALTQYEFWVTAIRWGNEDVNRQMYFLREAEVDGWEFIACNNEGQFIFRKPRS